jgi:type VI secretion system secreted protein VgrG
MHKDLQSPFTLTLTEGSANLQVNRFTGREALNEPYRFDIDLIHGNPASNPGMLLQQPAFLHLGDDTGIHGIIHCISKHYEGPLQTGYSLSLVPHLQALEQRTCRRVFHDLSVPGILRQLLEEHGIAVDSYRFELLIGLYPLRPLCIQYDESDLYFLQRLCEEEGIHYHFEHQPDRHVMVFADDSEGFGLLPVITPYRHPAEQECGSPTISELSECHFANFAQPMRAHDLIHTPCSDEDAANQAHGEIDSLGSRLAPGQAHRNQLGRRALERLRSQQRHIVGHSDQPRLHSGQILQVLSHPLSQFNDQWLLTEVQHQWQQTLTPCPLQQQWWEVAEQLGEEQFANTKTALLREGYSNQFKAIPWAVAFRPSLKHPKPSVPGYQIAYAAGPNGQPATQDEQGRIKARLAWDRQDAHDEHRGTWLPIARHEINGRLDRNTLPLAGSELLVSFIDSDPDRPVVWSAAGKLANLPPSPHSATGLYLNGQALAENTRRLHVESGQSLLIQENQTLTLTANGNRIHLSPDSLTLSGVMLGSTPAAVQSPAHEPENQQAAPGDSPAELWNGDICLFEHPPIPTHRLPQTHWYIVRMPRPGLQELASLGRDNILMEGKSQHSGSLDLSPEEKRQLALEFVRTPDQLCLLYPGQCVALAEYFQQHWSTEQRQAFMATGKATMAQPEPSESNLLFDWLVNRPDTWR